MRRVDPGIVMRISEKLLLALTLLLLLAGAAGKAKALTPGAAGQDHGAEPTARLTQKPEDGRGQPVFGKITAIKKGSIELAKPDGSTVTVKFTDKTEFRRDRQETKLPHFTEGEVETV